RDPTSRILGDKRTTSRPTATHHTPSIRWLDTHTFCALCHHHMTPSQAASNPPALAKNGTPYRFSSTSSPMQTAMSAVYHAIARGARFSFSRNAGPRSSPGVFLNQATTDQTPATMSTANSTRYFTIHTAKIVSCEMTP